MENISRSASARAIAGQKMKVSQARLSRQLMRQIGTRRTMRFLLRTGFSQVAIRKEFKTLEEHRSRRKALNKSDLSDEDILVIEETKAIDEAAEKFSKQNFELKGKTLLLLRHSINDSDTVEEILKKVLDFYPDYTLADEALDFLLETTHGPLALKMNQAKEFLNANFHREIVAGKNMNFQAQIFSKEGFGTPTALRDMYRDITGSPRTPNVLFEELSNKFSYGNLKVIIRFLLHSLGADLKSKGPSISRPELQRLLEDTTSLQAILGIFRFFQSREDLIEAQFKHFGLSMPVLLNFESLAKQFMHLLKERYISSEKILIIARLLGISEEMAAQIIIFTQMRDAIRHISPRLYKSQSHREDVLAAFIEALEELEEELDEEEEEEE